MTTVLGSSRPELARFGGVYRFKISGTRTFTCDLSTHEPTFYEGPSRDPDVWFEIADTDLLDLLANLQNVTALYKQGRIKMKGDLRRAFGFVGLLQVAPGN
ncbi:MAG TPA: SCP2 sterol-binding domain-containing protein [Thermoanaerobaculia bacterium]|jgi:ubiquinone biosynthesis protein UbiJ|nr:SCP2 sterol-binding domain-containing protein [Thermoanaerobaculia bacterium]